MPVLPGVEPLTPAGDAEPLLQALSERLAHRGWQFRASDGEATAHRPEWPAQLFVLARERSGDSEAILGLALELGSMPLRGERFRDIFNSDREDVLRSYGNFTVRQVTGEGTWLRPLNGRSFAHGMSDGISRRTRLAIFDRLAEGDDLVERFATDNQRFLETGSEMAALLQRLYQRTVLSVASPGPALPETVQPSVAMLPVTAEGDSTYPWRR